MAIDTTQETLDNLSDILLNTTKVHPLHDRFRALFTLKAVADDRAVHIIGQGFKDPSPLLKHEFAYVLGQMGNLAALPILSDVLANMEEDPMVRHEAGEALGALSSSLSLPILQKYLNDPERSVRETVELAIAKIEFDNSEEGKQETAALKTVAYKTIDPAPGASSDSRIITLPQIADLQSSLMNTKKPLFLRYRDMFTLRNAYPSTSKATDEAIVLALASGFKDTSALFRHEIAYIFGQLSSSYSVPSLVEVLRDTKEEVMVRHEAAEALGGIASEGEDGSAGVLDILREFAADETVEKVVRESCIVAVDMWEYETSQQFQPLDGTKSGEESGLTGFEKSLGTM